MKQEFTTLWKIVGDGYVEDHDFPTMNEQNVMDMLVKKNVMQNYIFLPKGQTPQSIKKVVITQIAEEKTTPTKTTQTKNK
jgi:hypothetical protein